MFIYIQEYDLRTFVPPPPSPAHITKKTIRTRCKSSDRFAFGNALLITPQLREQLPQQPPRREDPPDWA